MCDCMIPLGGGNEIGASAYFLHIGESNLLLDCGARLKGEAIYPDYDRLLQEISDFDQLDAIMISHGHYDHIGSFFKIASLVPKAQIFCTRDTANILRLQLLDFGRISAVKESEKIRNERYRISESMLQRIQIQPVMRPFKVKDCQITFFPAGHMPGAVMIDLQSPSHHVLYSGDFSFQSTFEVNTLREVWDLKPTVLLLNAPYAYFNDKDRQTHQENVEKDVQDSVHHQRMIQKIRKLLSENKKIYLSSRSVPKHLDLFYFLKKYFPNLPVRIEKESKKILDALVEMGYHVMGEHFLDEAQGMDDSVVIGQKKGRYGYTTVLFDTYSLHAGLWENIRFIRQMQANTVYLLHVDPDYEKKSMIEILKEGGDAAQVIQTENGQKYYLERSNEMKFIKVYETVIQDALEKAEKEWKYKKDRMTPEWCAIYGSLLYPEKHPQEAYQMVLKTYSGKQHPISYEKYLAGLESANLSTAQNRRYALEMAEKGVRQLKKAMDGDDAALKRFVDFTESLMQRDRQTRKIYFIGKYTLVLMLLIDPDLKDDVRYLSIVSAFGAAYCNQVLKRIRDALLRHSDLKPEKINADEMIRKTEKELSVSSETFDHMEFDSELDQLRFMNQNYEASLFMVQSMLDELKHSLSETAEAAKDQEIVEFYSKMNENKYGNLLDSMDFVSRRLADLKVEKFRIPPQLLPMTIVFKQLLRFMADCDVKIIEETGRIFETDYEGLAKYHYIGESFSDPGEVKTVRVEKPGWRYLDKVITFPTVSEINP